MKRKGRDVGLERIICPKCGKKGYLRLQLRRLLTRWSIVGFYVNHQRRIKGKMKTAKTCYLGMKNPQLSPGWAPTGIPKGLSKKEYDRRRWLLRKERRDEDEET